MSEELNIEHNAALSEPTTPIKHNYKLNNQLRIGIIGHANAGKSSLFNLISPMKTSYVSEELYTTTHRFLSTFATEDDKMKHLASLYHPDKVVDATMTIMDTPAITYWDQISSADLYESLAGMDLFIYVLRAFYDENISDIREQIDPYRDYKDIIDHFIESDKRVIDIAIEAISGVSASSVGQYTSFEAKVLLKAKKWLHGDRIDEDVKSDNFLDMHVHHHTRGPKPIGQQLRFYDWDQAEYDILTKYNVLSLKRVLCVVNLHEKQYARSIASKVNIIQDLQAMISNEVIIPFSIIFEHHQHQYHHHEQLSLPSNIMHIIYECYHLFHIVRFYVYRRKVLHSCVCVQGTMILDAIRVVDVELSRNFIRANVASYEDVMASSQEHHYDFEKIISNAFVVQGKRYVMQEGDVINIAT